MGQGASVPIRVDARKVHLGRGECAVGDGDRSEIDTQSNSDSARKPEHVGVAEGELAQARPDIDDTEAVDTGNQYRRLAKITKGMRPKTEVPKVNIGWRKSSIGASN